MSRKFAVHCMSAMLLVMAAGHVASAEPAPVPPPLVQRGADCGRPQYASDALVCSDPRLKALDAEVAALAAAPEVGRPDAILEGQPAWIRRRSLCAFKADHRACLLAPYTDRLAALTAASTAATQPWVCSGAWQGRRLAISAAVAGTSLTLRENGQLLAIATPKIAGWQPHLAWRATRRGVRLKTQDGKQFDCRPALH